MASHRLELIGRVAVAQLELERAVASLLAASGSVPAEIGAQLADLSALRQEIAAAGPADLPALNRAVAAVVASTSAAVQHAQSAATDRATATIADAAEASHRATQSAMDYTHNLSLRFTSEEDERGYRQREAERAAYIAAQQAKHTPEGDLSASGAAVGQMVDAHAHGASGPDFDKHWSELVNSTSKLRDAVRRSGGSTKEFNDHLRADLRGIMKAKGLSDAQIDAQFAAHADPLDAAKAYVAEGDVDGIRADIKRARPTSQTPTVPLGAPPLQVDIDTASAMADLKASGIKLGQPEPDGAPAHGLSIAVTTSETKSRTA